MPNKLQKFADFESFKNCFYLPFEKLNDGLELKGKWRETYFKNNNPIVLELGCGRGEYTIGLSKNNRNKNFIGVDIKGNRIWTGAKQALDDDLNHVAYIRTKIDFIHQCFEKEEVDEIWITFPDPQPNKPRIKNRLTHPNFLAKYFSILKPNGVIHLKTDSTLFYEYTLETIAELKLNLIHATADLYKHNPTGIEELTSIQTYYENLFTKKGEVIKYCCFSKAI